MSDRSSLVGPLTSALLVASAVTGHYFVRDRVTTFRPVAPVRAIAQPGAQNIDARLWQDPLTAVLTADEGDVATARGFVAGVRERIEKASEQRKVTMLPVLVPGRGYAEDSETRRRIRVAVLSALFAADYVPDSTEHIGSFTHLNGAAGPHAAPPNQAEAAQFPVAFEWFSRAEEAGHPSSALVLWLPERALGDDPLACVARVVRSPIVDIATAGELSRSATEALVAKVRLCTIGPSNSDTLATMAGQALLKPTDGMRQEKPPTGSGGDPIDRAEIRAIVDTYLSSTSRLLSPRATVPDAHLIALARTGTPAADEGDASTATTLDAIFAEAHHKAFFTRTHCTDAALAYAVLEELSHRNLDHDGSTRRIALIVERDTLYGRTVERTFEAALEHRNADGAPELVDDAVSKCVGGVTSNPPSDHGHSHLDVEIEVFSYFRGIDGVTAASTARPRATPAKPTDDPPTADLLRQVLEPDAYLPAEASFGPAQYDRVLQLADTIAEHGRKNGRFHAIGIIGSDIYDKLAILQAVKPRFPDKVFFTTDLDARLVPNAQTPFTRNLVVASGFGFELDTRVQRDTAAFRDGYQCATYLATLLALDDPVFGDAPITSAELAPLLRPAIFEMGRTMAVDLSPPPPVAAPSSSSSDSSPTAAPPWLHPTPDPWLWHDSGIRAMALTVLLGVVFLLPLRGFLRRTRNRAATATPPVRGHWLTGGLVFTGALVLACCGGAIAFYVCRVGEPIEMFQGVSIWLTEIVRLAGCALALVLMWHGVIRLRHADAATAARFFPATTPPHANASPEHAWQRYREDGAPHRRLGRITPLLLGLIVVAAVVLLWPPAPRPPVRGEFAFWLDQVIGFWSIVLTVLLALGVSDAARLSARFIHRLGDATGPWPESEALRQIVREHGVRREDASDHLRIQLVGERTAGAGGVLWYPFAVLALMVFGQFSTFDAWRWPIPFVLALVALAVSILVAGAALTRAAARVRGAALDRMRSRVAELRAAGRPPGRIERDERLLQAAEGIDGGTPGGLQHPLLDAVLLPSSGLAALSLIDLAALVMTG